MSTFLEKSVVGSTRVEEFAVDICAIGGRVLYIVLYYIISHYIILTCKIKKNRPGDE